MFGYVRPAFRSARGPVQTAINKRVGRQGKQSAQGPWPLPERQSPDTDAFAIRRDCGAFRESVLALNVARQALGHAATPPKDARVQSLQGARGNRGPTLYTRFRRYEPFPESACPRPVPFRFRRHEPRPTRAGGKSSPHAERAPAPAECASCHAIDAQSLIIDSRCCVAQRLLEIFGLEKGVLGEQRSAVRMRRK